MIITLATLSREAPMPRHPPWAMVHESTLSKSSFNVFFLFFFRIHSALCLDPQAGGKVAKRRVLCFLAALWAFAFRPRGSSWRALSALPPSSSSSLAQPPEAWRDALCFALSQLHRKSPRALSREEAISKKKAQAHNAHLPKFLQP